MSNITTFAQLKQAMQEYIAPKRPNEVVEDADVLWFVCTEQARVLSNSGSLSDIASLFSDGIQPMTKAGVDEFLETLNEDESEEVEDDERETLTDRFADFFGS